MWLGGIYGAREGLVDRKQGYLKSGSNPLRPFFLKLIIARINLTNSCVIRLPRAGHFLRRSDA